MVELLDRLFLHFAFLESSLQNGHSLLNLGFLGFVVRLKGLEFVDFFFESGDLIAQLDPVRPAILKQRRLSGLGRFMVFKRS